MMNDNSMEDLGVKRQFADEYVDNDVVDYAVLTLMILLFGDDKEYGCSDDSPCLKGYRGEKKKRTIPLGTAICFMTCGKTNKKLSK